MGIGEGSEGDGVKVRQHCFDTGPGETVTDFNIRVGPLKITAKVGVGILVHSHGNGSALGKPLLSLCLLFSSMYCGINIFESSHCRIEVINTRHFDRPCPNTLPFPLALTSTVFQLNHFFTRHPDPLLGNSRSLRFTKRL